MLEINIMEDAKKHMLSQLPKESCGLVVDNKYVPCENLHEDPDNNFKINPKHYVEADSNGGIQAVIHSHPTDPCFPSELDMKQQMATNVPWCILTPTKQPLWWGDQVPTSDLIGREFIFGVHDCYAAIRDWYKVNRNILLPNFPRMWNFWNKGINTYVDNFESAGFKEVSSDTPLEIGDVFLGSILSKQNIINHGAVFIGNGLIYHHLVDRLSLREPYVNWSKYLSMRLRYSK